MPRQTTTIGNNTSGLTQYSNPIIFDLYGRPQVSLQLNVTGTVTVTVQQTLDNVLDPTVTPTWFPHTDANLVKSTAAKQSNYAFVPAAARLALATGSTGQATLIAIQPGPMQ